MRILLAEDEQGLANGLKYLLEKQKISVDVAFNGDDALDLLSVGSYDAAVLDIMMPGKSGLEVLAEIRRKSSSLPVMMLTAKAEVEDKILGLEAGADDYLAKPFNTGEFIARVKALLRRSGSSYSDDSIRFGSITLNRDGYELSNGTKSVRLNNKEFQLTELFMLNPRRVYSTELLMDKIWGIDSKSNLDVVWTYIGALRKKFRELDADVEIKTVRGAGYMLEEI